MADAIKCVQINMNRSGLAAVSLNEKLKSVKGNYLCFTTEPYRFKGNLARLPQKCTLIPERNTIEDPRAAIWSNMDLIEISSLCTKDCAVALLEHKEGRTLIASIYMDMNERVEQEFLLALLDYSNENKYPLIIGTDTNCHSNMFGPESNKRGADLEELIIEHSLVIENIGHEPTYEVIRGNNHIKTCIDATLTRDLGGAVKAWTVDREYNGSDHNTITFDLQLHTKEIKAERNWNKGDWPELNRLLKAEEFYEPFLITEKKLDRCLQQLYKKLYKILDKVCPMKKIRKKVKANVWYTKDLRRLAKRIKKAYKNSIRLLGDSKVYYKKLLKKYRKLIKKRRRSSLEEVQRNQTNSKRHGEAK